MVRQAVVAGLLSSGCRVIDLDICPVPTVQLLVRGSNTEPIIRIVVESDTDEGARRLMEDVKTRVGACLDAPVNDTRESQKLER